MFIVIKQITTKTCVENINKTSVIYCILYVKKGKSDGSKKLRDF